MPIQVICPGCHTRFNVGDEHAGKSGACPKCKGPIEIPKLEDQVVVHAPEMEPGTVDSQGRSILKPIARKEAKFSVNITVAVVGMAILSFAIAWLLGQNGVTDMWALGVGAVLLGPPLAYAAYTFLRDEELGIYEGTSVLLRSLSCGLVYALLWGVYMYVATQLFDPEKLAVGGLGMIQILPLSACLLAIGAFAAFVSFDLEPINGFFHCTLYFLLTVLLRLAMGLPLLPGM